MSNYEKGFPCSCHNEMVSVDAIPEFDDDIVILSYRYRHIGKYSLKMRLGLVWGLLTGKDVDVGEVVFDPEVANELGWEILTKSQPLIRDRKLKQ